MNDSVLEQFITHAQTDVFIVLLPTCEKIMAITSITIENFKGIGDAVTIPIRPITLLFGKNSSGKSTVLQALHYMREVWEHAGADADRTDMGGDYIDLGGFRSLVHLHDSDRKVRIRIEFDLTSEESEKLNSLLKHETDPGSAWIEAVTSWNTKIHNVCTESYEYGLNSTEWIRFSPMERLEARPSDTVGSNGTEWHRLDNTILPTFLNIKHPCIKSPIADDYLKILEEGLFMLRGIIFKELRAIRYLGPIRKLPPRNHCPQKTPDESLWAEGLEAWNLLGRNNQLIEKINYYMRDILKLGYSISWQEIISLDKNSELIKNIKKICNSENFEIDELKKQVYDLIEQLPHQIRMKLHDEKNNVDLDAVDVGLGISQVIPVLVGALHYGVPDPNRYDGSQPVGKFFAVEQPELHLHPAAQVALGDVFIDCTKNPVRESKALFESVEEKVDQDFEDNIKEYADRWMKFMTENIDHPHLKKLIESTGENSFNKAAAAILRRFASNNAEYEKFSNDLQTSGKTLLIETHSEHLLLRLLRRVRETTRRSRHKKTESEQTDHELTPNDLSVIYVRPTPAGVKFTPLTVTNNGDFDAPWPEGFFEERESEWY